MEKHLMSTYTPKLLDCRVRNSVVETAAVGMGKNDRYSHFKFTLNGAVKGSVRVFSNSANA
jgi:hypothetical protein